VAAIEKTGERHRNAVDATGRQVGENVRRLRQARNLSTRRLSEELERLGRPIPPTGITRIEKGRRAVDVDDLMTLAVVLKVSPLTLLLPAVSSTVPTEVTAVGSIPSWKAWRWSRAVEPLKEPYSDEELADFHVHAMPKTPDPGPAPWER